jgi:hypothetical protein
MTARLRNYQITKPGPYLSSTALHRLIAELTAAPCRAQARSILAAHHDYIAHLPEHEREAFLTAAQDAMI